MTATEKPFHIRTTPEQLRLAALWAAGYYGAVDLIVDDRMLVARVLPDDEGVEHVMAWDTGGEPATQTYLSARLWETEPFEADRATAERLRNLAAAAIEDEQTIERLERELREAKR